MRVNCKGIEKIHTNKRQIIDLFIYKVIISTREHIKIKAVC